MKLAQAELEKKNKEKTKTCTIGKQRNGVSRWEIKSWRYFPLTKTSFLCNGKVRLRSKGTKWGNSCQVEVNKKVKTHHINMLKLYVERGRIEETATPGPRDIPEEPRAETQVGCVCVQGVQGVILKRLQLGK